MSCPSSVHVRFLLVPTLLLVAIVVQGADPHPYHEGNYGTAGLPHTELSGSKSTWDYKNLNEWPELCRTGSRQSPISFTNVDPSDVVEDASLQRLQFSSKCFFPKDQTQMRVLNDGAVNMVSFEHQGRLPEDLSECAVVDPLNKSRTFYFSELHFHATSEHKFRNLRPDVEMHLSFITDEVKEKKRKMLIVAVMLKASSSINSTSVRALRHILVDGSLPRPHTMTTCFLTEDMSITSILPARESYLLYDGSETHPPCRENVRWVIMTSPVLVSRVAVGKLRDAMDQLLPNDFHRFGNVRPPQALNGRRIYRFDDTSVPQGSRRNEGDLDDTWNKKKPQNGAPGVLNETVVIRNIRLQKEGVVPEDSAFVDNGVDTYGDDGKTNSSTTTSSNTNTAANYTTASTASAEATTRAAASSTKVTAVTAAPTSSSVYSTVAASGNESAGYIAHKTDHENSTVVAAASSVSTKVAEATAPAVWDSTAIPVSANNGSTNATTSEITFPPSSTVELMSPTNTSSGNYDTTTSTKRTTTRKGNKGHGSLSKNTTETASSANKAATANNFKSADGVMSMVTTYAKRHPGSAIVIVLCSITLFFLIVICILRWRLPVYVVGIDPRELEPLNPNPAFGQYGGTTSASAVQPATQRTE